MNRKSYGIFLIMVILLLSIGIGCSTKLDKELATKQAESFDSLQVSVNEFATVQAESFMPLQNDAESAAANQAEAVNVLQQDLSSLATTQAESFTLSHENVAAVATQQVTGSSALQQEDRDIATAQAESFIVLRDIANTHTELMTEVNQNVQMVATAVVPQVSTITPSVPISESLAMGVGLLWRQANSDEVTTLDFKADQSFQYDNKSNLLTDWSQTGKVLLIWQQTTSTKPEDSINSVQGNLYPDASLISEHSDVDITDNINFAALQNLLFLTSPGSDPLVLVRGRPQDIIDVKPLEQTTILQEAFIETKIPFDQIDHLIIMLEAEGNSENGQSQLIMLTLESSEVVPPGPGDPNCGQYCSQCYTGICQPVCWACGLFN